MTNRWTGTTARTALVVLCFLSLFFQGCAQRNPMIVIKSTTLIDGRTGSATENVTIVVRDGRIATVGDADRVAVPAEARVIDGNGKWVTPGFVDVHVHDGPENYLQKLLALGVTSIHLMPGIPPDNPVSFEERSQLANTPSPRIHVSGIFSGEWPDNVFPGDFELLKPKTEAEARKAVQDLEARGFRQIKIIQDDSRLWVGAALASPRLAPPVFEALVDEAHELDMRVYVHAAQQVDTRAAVLADADTFMHGTMDALVDSSLWEQMKIQQMVWSPAFGVVIGFGDYGLYSRRILADANLTAILSEEEHSEHKTSVQAETTVWDERFAIVGENLESYLSYLGENTRQAQKLGVPIAVGSDGGPAGVGAHLEMEFLQDAGLTPNQVIVAATHGGALALGVEDEIGSVEPGKLADLVVLNANPVTDIRNARRIEWVIKGGALFDPSELVAGVEE